MPPQNEWLPIELLSKGLPGYFLIRDRDSKPDDHSQFAPQNVPVVISWEPYQKNETYQFTELVFHKTYDTPKLPVNSHCKSVGFAPMKYNQFMWLKGR